MITLYVLRGTNDKHYVGITNNLQRRLPEHRSGRTKGGQLLRRFALVHTEHFPDYPSARKREVFLKSGQGRQWLRDHLEQSLPAEGGQGKPD